MFDDRTFDIIYLEIKLKNDELERQLMLEKLGIRARYLDAIRSRQTNEMDLQESVLPIQNAGY